MLGILPLECIFSKANNELSSFKNRVLRSNYRIGWRSSIFFNISKPAIWYSCDGYTETIQWMTWIISAEMCNDILFKTIQKYKSHWERDICKSAIMHSKQWPKGICCKNLW